MSSDNSREIFVTSEDLKLLYRRHRKALTRLFVLVGIGIFSLLIFKMPIYKATAAFKQSSNKSDHLNSELKNFLKM